MFPSPNSEGFFVYTKDNCKYCLMVKELIPDASYINTESLLVEKKEEFLTFIEGLVGKSHRTFPIVFYNGAFVGGFIETHRLCAKFEAENDSS